MEWAQNPKIPKNWKMAQNRINTQKSCAMHPKPKSTQKSKNYPKTEKWHKLEIIPQMMTDAPKTHTLQLLPAIEPENRKSVTRLNQNT